MGENDKLAKSKYARIQGFNAVTDKWEAITFTSNSAIPVEIKGGVIPMTYTSANLDYNTNDLLTSAVYFRGTAIISVLTLTYNTNNSIVTIVVTSATAT